MLARSIQKRNQLGEDPSLSRVLKETIERELALKLFPFLFFSVPFFFFESAADLTEKNEGVNN